MEAGWERVLDEDALPEGARKIVQMSDGRHVLVLRYNGGLHALDATCYHMGGPLLAADIEDLSTGVPCIVCPWHGYTIALESGERLYQDMQGSCQSAGKRQRVHAVRSEGGGVWVLCSGGDKVESDNYAYKKPPPSQRGSVRRSGQVLGGRGAPGEPRSVAAMSANGSDGKAPWMVQQRQSRRDQRAMEVVMQANARLAAAQEPQWLELTVKAVKKLNHNSVLLSVSSPESVQRLCGGTGQHLDVQHPSGELRPYTPFWLPGGTQAELLVKCYPGGAVSPWLSELAQGSTVRAKLGKRTDTPRVGQGALGMIAGGTGISPMLQVLAHLAGTGRLPGVRVSLLYANRAQEDILLREELEALAAQHKIKLVHLLSQPEPGWEGATGYVSKELLEAHLEPEGPVLCCGPPGMHELVRSLAEELGSLSRLHEFQ